jgi:hypothetical protein
MLRKHTNLRVTTNDISGHFKFYWPHNQSKMSFGFVYEKWLFKYIYVPVHGRNFLNNGHFQITIEVNVGS